MPEPCRHPLCEAHDAFLASRGTRVLSPHTLRRYRQDIHGVVLKMKDQSIGIDDLDGPLAAALNAYAVDKNKSTVAGAISTWTTWVNAMLSDETLTRNPMRTVERPKIPPADPKPLDKPQETTRRLMDYLASGQRRADARRPWPERDLALIAVYVFSGVRLHELTAANMRDLSTDTDNASLRVVGKGARPRWAPIPPEVVDALTAFQATRTPRFPDTKVGPMAPLIVNDKGERLHDYQVQYIVAKAYEAAGVSARKPPGALVHALRHTCATLLASADTPATSIQKVLGHASLATSQRYVSVADDVVHKAARRSPALAALRKPDAD